MKRLKYDICILSNAVVGVLLRTARVFGCNNNATFANVFNVSLAPKTVLVTTDYHTDVIQQTELRTSLSQSETVHRQRSSLSPDKSKLMQAIDNYIVTDTMTPVVETYLEALPITEFPAASNSYYTTAFLPEQNLDISTQKFDLHNEQLYQGDEAAWKNTVEKYALFRRRELFKDITHTFVEHLDDAMDVIDDILDEYPLNSIALSFNGGKDCTLLLHLLRVKIDQRYGPNARIQGVHIDCDDSFPEIRTFIDEACKKYRIDLYEYSGPLKVGLQHLKEEQPGISVILMGSRSTDPHGIYMKSKKQWTDAGWPHFLRVFPILDWTYSDVWRVIRGLRVPYCSLYDQGYTSLGEKEKTRKNDALKILDETGRIKGYRPAYELDIGSLERLGRKSSDV